MIDEIWKDILEYIGLYMISNYGMVKSLNYRYTGKEQILKPNQISKYGHLQIGLYKNGIRKRYLVHRLVMETFVGPCPTGKEVCHNDGDPSNNFVENLRYDTQKNNARDSINQGTFIKGSRQGLSKLNDNKIIEIRKLYKEGVSQKQLSIKFNIGTSAIWSIVNYKTWKHIKGNKNVFED